MKFFDGYFSGIFLFFFLHPGDAQFGHPGPVEKEKEIIYKWHSYFTSIEMNKPTKLKKGLYIFSGMISLVLAYIGIIVPGFPGIPFIILASYFFTNSSPRIYDWMMRQRVMKKLMDKSKKINRNVFKYLLVSQVWFSVAVAEFTLARNLTAKVLFAVAGVVLTILVFVFMKSHEHSRTNNKSSDNKFSPKK
jgi:uncharacterized membrane protein YbaN (DUF454 family)